MSVDISKLIDKRNIKDFKEFTIFISSGRETFLLRNDIIIAFEQFCTSYNKSSQYRKSSSLALFLNKIQELFLVDEHIALMHRYSIARYRFYLLRRDGEHIEEIDVRTYLDLKDSYVLNGERTGKHLHIDYMPFYDFSPHMKDSKTLGNGITYLNRYLSSKIFNNPEKWNKSLFEFIQLHKYREQQLLVNGSLIQDFPSFFEELEKMMAWVKTRKPATPYEALAAKMKRAGFEPGWGNTAERITATMQLLIDLINEPTGKLLEQFISRVPMPLISKVAIISPHGWFAQENVLGKPDTGGQVIYILDQVRALEKYLKEEIRLSGLSLDPKIIVLTRLIPEAENTSCNIKQEKIYETENSWILRIPFTDDNFDTVKHWISRFDIWPYLEKFAEDSETELISEFAGKPDLIIGNYSDGNLVASLLSQKMDVIQCTVAHALEKSKYLFSDMYWQEREETYHFSLQFVADIIAMNKSDFIIASTYQEIAGTETTIGQYESYQFFTMPGLMQIESGINLYAPKFNVIPPGVDEDIYFPYHETEKRSRAQKQKLEGRLFSDKSPDIYGTLHDTDKIPIFTMARFDRIKNITGLIEAFGLSKKLQERCNLVFSAGSIHINESADTEEREEIERAYHLIEQYSLDGKIRWLPNINRLDTGEIYRIIADYKGIFVQPALFEAFGLTILEAMVSGLPTMGPVFGGPLEIINDGESGILMNTSTPDLIKKSIETVIDQCSKDKSYWGYISENGIQRIKEHYTWRNYSERLVFLTKLYGFWRYSVSGQGKMKMDRYTDMIYHFLFKERARF